MPPGRTQKPLTPLSLSPSLCLPQQIGEETSALASEISRLEEELQVLQTAPLPPLLLFSLCSALLSSLLLSAAAVLVGG